MLPDNFPKWRTIYENYRKWGEIKNEGKSSPLDRSLKKIVGQARLKHGQKEHTSFCIIDAQSVKNTDTAEEKR